MLTDFHSIEEGATTTSDAASHQSKTNYNQFHITKTNKPASERQLDDNKGYSFTGYNYAARG